MSAQYFPLDQIDPNPFQTRAGEDPEHIKQLALSILKDTLLQIPIGRRVGERVQLAEKIYSWDYTEPNPTHAVDAFNDLFKKARMRLMVDVSTETEGG